MRNNADTPKNTNAGKPKKPAHIPISLYGIGVTAVRTIINIPCRKNIARANSKRSADAKFSISHSPTESNKNIPIRYANMPPTNEPTAAATVIGNARRRSAIMAGVIKTSGGMKRNVDSQIVIKNTTHVYMGCAARDNR